MKIQTLVINDRILIKYVSDNEGKSRGGIIIPPKEGKEIVFGYVKEKGEGHAHFDYEAESNVPGAKKSRVYYIPLKVMIGDLVYFYKDSAAEILIEGERFFVTDEKNILLINRQDGY